MQTKAKSTIQRVSAAIAATAVTLSIVWSIAGYAYPELPASWLGQMATKAPLKSGS
jgi:hypothetical protein